VSLGSRTVQLERFGIPQLIFFFADKFLVLAKTVFFPQKIPYFAIFYGLGWLVGCDLVPLLGMYVSTTF